MSGCSTHGGLLGGYVLGSLEPAEMEEMRRHVAGCPECGPAARELGSLPDLLDRIEPTDVPPPTLSPSVEEAVLDRFARERRRPPQPRRRRFTVPRLAALGAAVAAAVVMAVVLIGDDEGSTSYAWARLSPVGTDSKATGKAYVSEVPAGTRVSLRARGLPDGRMYELWCVRENGRWVSGGTFRAGRDGRAEAVLTAAVRPGDYHVVVVTRHQQQEGYGAPLLRGPLEY